MTRSIGALGLVAGTVLVLGVAAGVVAVRAGGAATAAEAGRQGAAHALAETRDRVAALDGELRATRTRSEALSAVLDARRDFVAAVAAARTALESAGGKVDVSSQRQRILDAQTTVLAERADAGVVATAAADVRAATTEVADAVAAHDAEQARLVAARVPGPVRSDGSGGRPSAGGSAGGGGTSGSGGASDGGGDWFADARAILTRVGGGDIELRAFDGSCGAVEVAACAYIPAYIGVMPSFASLSYGRKVWLMTHELAHFYEGYVWWDILDSPTFGALFGGDMERLADCMAQVRGAYSGCSGDQVSWAAGIWDGAVG